MVRFLGNKAPCGWRPVDVQPKAGKRFRDRELSATMSDGKKDGKKIKSVMMDM
jgi:hypothetical protein